MLGFLLLLFFLFFLLLLLFFFFVFFNFFLRKYVLLFFAEFELLMFHNNIVKIVVKIKQVKLVEKLPPSYLPYRFLHKLCSFLLCERVKIFEKKKKNND